MKLPDSFTSFRYSDFRLRWIGQSISHAGTEMQFVALNWHIYEVTRSAWALALLGLTRIVPVVIFGLIAGSIVDRFNRKKILFITQIFQASLALLLAIITWKGLATPMFIYAINSVLSAIYSIDSPASQSFLPHLVPRKHFGNAVSLGVVGYNVSRIFGPAVGGFVIAYLGVGHVYAINAASFLVLFSALLFVRADGAIVGERPSATLIAIKEGVRFVQKNTIIWSTMLLDFFSTLFAEATILLPIFVKEILRVGPKELGILYAAPFVGATISGIIAASIGKGSHRGSVLLWSVVLYAIGTIVFGLSSNYILSLIALLIIGIGDGMSTIIRNIIRQLVTPDHIRGRMTAINMIFYTGGPRLGEVEAGIVAGLIGASGSVIVGGIGTIVVVAIMAATIPVLRNYKAR